MHIRREHHFSPEEAREKVDILAAELEKKFMLRSRWNGDRLEFNGGGASGEVTLGDDYVELNVKLGFALKLMEPTLRAAIEETLDEQINSA